MDSNWNIKVADFGLAKFTTNTQSIKSTVGTYNYMAPEVMNGHPYSTKADVYRSVSVARDLARGRQAVDRNEPWVRSMAMWPRTHRFYS